MLTVISMSKGCAEPCHENPIISTDKIRVLANLIDKGAIVAISKELGREIQKSCRESGSWHSDIFWNIILRANNAGSLWEIDDLPVFVEDGNNTEPFALVGTLIIQFFETEYSDQWKKYLFEGKLQAGEETVRVKELSRIEQDIMAEYAREVEVGEPFQEVRKLLTVPMMWSQRIILYDQYALKNAMKSRDKNFNFTSGLDRFLEHLVKVRKDCGEPLHELTLITHPSPRTWPGAPVGFFKKEMALNGLREICNNHGLHEWVDKIYLRFTKDDSEGERFIVFEYSQTERCFIFGVKGLVSLDGKTPDSEIMKKFTIYGPLRKSQWRPFKDKLKTFNKHVIESTI